MAMNVLKTTCSARLELHAACYDTREKDIRTANFGYIGGWGGISYSPHTVPSAHAHSVPSHFATQRIGGCRRLSSPRRDHAHGSPAWRGGRRRWPWQGYLGPPISVSDTWWTCRRRNERQGSKGDERKEEGSGAAEGASVPVRPHKLAPHVSNNDNNAMLWTTNVNTTTTTITRTNNDNFSFTLTTAS